MIEKTQEIIQTFNTGNIREFIRNHKLTSFSSFVMLLVVLFIFFVKVDGTLLNLTSIIFVMALTIFIYDVLSEGKVKKEHNRQQDDEMETMDSRKVETVISRGPFSWNDALKCDSVHDKGKNAQCEFDGFTLYQQLGDFNEWVDINKGGRSIYKKDFKKLRKDKCNLFNREDLQTSCKLNKVKY